MPGSINTKPRAATPEMESEVMRDGVTKISSRDLKGCEGRGSMPTFRGLGEKERVWCKEKH